MKIDATKLRALVKSNGLTNTTLAAKAGITRQALQTMLKADHVVEVRDRTAKGLTQALRLPDESLLSPDPLAGYKEAIAKQHEFLDFRGLGLPMMEPRRLDDLFVPVRVRRMPVEERDGDCRPPTATTDKPSDENGSNIEGASDEALDPSSQNARFLCHDCYIKAREAEPTVAKCLDLHRRVLIRGEPASGKTTALRHAALTYARGLPAAGDYPQKRWVPLLVRLAELAKARECDDQITLVQFVVSRVLRDPPPNYVAEIERRLEKELSRGTCLVLLDGLDEVNCGETLRAVLHQFIEVYPTNQFVLTSRIVGLDVGPWHQMNFVTFEIARWGEDDIREFAQRWYAARPATGRKHPKKQQDQRAEELIATILGHPPLREIASNPLMLTILAELHYANAKLPRRRVDLYAKIVEVMLETWEASKRESRPGDPLHGIVLEAREFEWLLARLALAMQREGCILRPRWWLSDVVQKFLRDEMALEGDQVKDQAERVIRYLCERAGLLVERGDRVFGFYHRTFQEYFAARGLLLEVEGGGDIVTLLRPYLFHPQWEEVVVHVAASLSAPRATTLVRVILDDPDPAGRFLRRSQRLALRCLVDGAAVADRALLDQIFSDGEAIGGSRWLGIAFGLISLLKQLLATRHEAKAQQMLSEIDKGARKELPDNHYVAVFASSHDLPDGPKDGAPGTVCRKRLGGRQVELVWPAWEKRIKDPDSWYAEALKSVRNPKNEVGHRIALISFLGEEADSSDRARRALKELLARDRLPTIRAECAEALEGAVSADSGIAKLLLERLEKDNSDVVRARCAEALRSLAQDSTEVRTRLEELFASGPELVRAGAARGLSRQDFTSPDRKALLERFLAIIASPAEPSWVRHACIWAIASSLGRDDMEAVNRVVEECLDDHDPIVRRVALHVLADAIAEGRREWSQPLVERIETMLMAVTDPCRHLFGDLVMIVAKKEIQGGGRFERLLGDALTPFGDLIKIAFVFGSVARLEQIRDSDIDLMVVGDLRLKDLAAALHAAEQTLGRTVNPVLFSPEKFRDQYREGNPFLLDVVRKEKMFLKGKGDELTELVADRSID